MNTTCESCGRRIYGDPHIQTRDGAFCAPQCFLDFVRDVPAEPFVPVFSDEDWLIEPPEVQIGLPGLCHP